MCPSDASSVTSSLTAASDQTNLNPVVQRVKVIMSLGLVAVHLHRKFFSIEVFSSSTSLTASPDSIELFDCSSTSTDDVHDYHSTVLRNISLSADQLVTFGLAILLLLKYMFYDKSQSPSSTPSFGTISSSSTNTHTISTITGRDSSIPISTPSHYKKKTLETITEISALTDESVKGGVTTQEGISVSTQTNDHCSSVASFTVGPVITKDNSRLEEAAPLIDDSNGDIRSVDKCLEIFKSEVRE